MPAVLKIAVPAPLRRLFDYLPARSGDLPAPGCRVEVEFGRRTLIGVVCAIGEPEQPNQKLKSIKKVLDDTPVIDPDLLVLCQRIADYYHHPIGDVIATALPSLIRQGQDARVSGELFWCLTERGHYADVSALARAPRQQQALELLKQHRLGVAMPMLTALDIPRSALQALEKKGWAELREMIPEHLTSETLLSEVPLSASVEQQAAISALQEAKGFAPFLLDGITGSGKTEVYLQAMTPLLAAGKQILVLVPEIGLTPQTVRRFEKRFNVPVESLHSGMTDRERLHGWVRSRQGDAKIILGTRSAIFTPLQNPGMIIVDEAHDGSFKQQEGLRYNARDLAVWRARMLDIPVVLGSATPALETLYLAEQGRYRHLHLRERAGDANPPTLKLEDCRQLPGNTPISPRSLEAIRATLNAGQQVLVFINRRGYAPVIQCNDCGWQAECPRCDTFLTWHKSFGKLVCHHCEHERRVPAHCPSCGSSALTDAGSGTEKIAEQLQKALPKFPVLRIDRDTTRRKGALDEALSKAHAGGASVLVGTQMLAKGHHFANLALAIVLDADGGFLSADFRGPEHSSQLILQVAGRTGRAQHAGTVIIQSRHPEHPLLHTLLSGNYATIARTLLQDRQMTGLPPCGHLAMLRSESLKAAESFELLSDLASIEVDPRVQMLGPIPAPLERRQGRYRFQLLMRADHRAPLHGAIEQVLTVLEQHPLARRCRWNLDVDPLDML
ncbi:MAG: primosomal protein N' [Alcanivoracaceae bacterium]|nr:primosomal protein N' [Alcanivoracaceae bacterium]